MDANTVHELTIGFALAAGGGYIAVATTLLVRGLRRRGMARLGPANLVTTVRSTLVGVVTALVVLSLGGLVAPWVVVVVAGPALALDGVDGWVARRTSSVSELGARYDMEVDAFLLLVLSICASQAIGVWVLAIGLMRYAFVAALLILPPLRQTLPTRYWRKVAAAVQGIALTLAVSRLLPGSDVVIVAAALALLVESFGRDVIWLVRRWRPENVRRASAAPTRASEHRVTTGRARG